MTATLPRRKSDAPPRRGIGADITDTAAGWRWSCWECVSATGSAPTLAAAARAVQAHQMAAHAGGESRV